MDAGSGSCAAARRPPKERLAGLTRQNGRGGVPEWAASAPAPPASEFVPDRDGAAPLTPTAGRELRAPGVEDLTRCYKNSL